ncbi:MAG: pyrroline-5-carboxylate reductase, partial [Alphaproteobacteria bacterium]|nr:pyrroline-5-carboxylate reductase [Alphaproteobacteria bacterium]
MLRGWVAAQIASRFIVVEPAGLPAAFSGAAGFTWHPTPDALPDRPGPDAIVFAIKPQIADEVVPAYARWAAPETLFLSIAAGKTIGGLLRHLGPAALVRAMPNTPAAIGRAITVACPNQCVTARQRALCDALLAAIGESAWVED